MNSINILQIVAGMFAISTLFYFLAECRISKLNKSIKSLQIKNNALQNDFTAICSSAVNMGNRIESLDTIINTLTDRQEKYELQDPSNKTYKQAKILLNNGVDLEDVVDNCDVTYGEAELLAMLQRHEKQGSHH